MIPWYVFKYVPKDPNKFTNSPMALLWLFWTMLGYCGDNLLWTTPSPSYTEYYPNLTHQAILILTPELGLGRKQLTKGFEAIMIWVFISRFKVFYCHTYQLRDWNSIGLCSLVYYCHEYRGTVKSFCSRAVQSKKTLHNVLICTVSFWTYYEYNTLISIHEYNQVNHSALIKDKGYTI